MMTNLIWKIFPKRGMEKNKTTTLKGIMALYLVLIHLRTNTVLAEILPVNFVLMVSGQLICSNFFFISGYGIMTSFKNKSNYLKGFLRRKVLPLYIQYLFILALTLLYRILLLKETVEMGQLIRSITFGGTYVIYGWYLQVAILTYLLFYLIFSLRISNNAKKCLFAGGIFLYVMVALLSGAKSMWYDSVLAIVLGVFVADLPMDEQTPKLPRGGEVLLWLACMIGSALFIVFGNTTIVTKLGLPQWLIIVFKMAAPVFVLPLVVLTMSYVKATACKRLKVASISMFVYLTHGIAVSLWHDVCKIDNQIVYVLAVYATTILFSFALKHLFLLINRRLERKRKLQ